MKAAEEFIMSELHACDVCIDLCDEMVMQLELEPIASASASVGRDYGCGSALCGTANDHPVSSELDSSRLWGRKRRRMSSSGVTVGGTVERTAVGSCNSPPSDHDSPEAIAGLCYLPLHHAVAQIASRKSMAQAALSSRFR